MSPTVEKIKIKKRRNKKRSILLRLHFTKWRSHVIFKKYEINDFTTRM